MYFKFFIGVVFIFSQSLFSQSMTYDNRWAVVVGINDYKNDNIPDLNYAVSDAEDIKSMLVDFYGFDPQNITTLLNEEATERNIKKEISEKRNDE